MKAGDADVLLTKINVSSARAKIGFDKSAGHSIAKILFQGETLKGTTNDHGQVCYVFKAD